MINRLKIADQVKNEHLRFLRILWCDNANLIRSKAIHLPSLLKQIPVDGHEEKRSEHLLRKLETSLTKSLALQALPVVFDEPVSEAGLEPVKEINLVPDWSTLTALPYAPGHMQVMGDMMIDGTHWELCPRELLRRAVRRLDEAGYEVMIGAEIEFFLFEMQHPDEGRDVFPDPVDRDLYAMNSAFEYSRDVIDDIADSLWNQGIELAYYNAESGPGQHELSLHYTDPLTLADRIVSTRTTIRSVASEHGLITSFVPKLIQDQTGSGCHLHLSLWRDGGNIMPKKGGNWDLSTEGEAFTAGILDHLPGLMAMTTPTPNSFRRILPHEWSGAFRVWGIDNKEAAIRVLGNPLGEGPKHFELKTSDLSANPYIALTGVVSAGLDGIKSNHTLSEPLQVDPGSLSDEERTELGVELLPTSVPEALAKLDEDTVLKEAFGEEYYKVYTAVRRFEQEELGGLSLEEERKILLTLY